MAEGGTMDRIRNSLECSICLELYEEPKMLKCTHEYCKHCLEDIAVFAKDGALSITCPLRCNMRTLLEADQTVNDLVTSFSTKNIVETLNSEDQKSGDNHPMCSGDRECKKQSSLFCCGTMMCEWCHRNHMKISDCEVQHRKLNLSFSALRNQLSVVCDKHVSRCTHLCVENIFLCMYCLHRDEEHRNHPMNNLETEARLLRESLNRAVNNHEESVAETVQSIADARKDLEVILQQRKEQCIDSYKTLLEEERLRLMDKFESLSKRHTDGHFSSTQYCSDLLKRMDTELVLQKEEILRTLDEAANVPCEVLELSQAVDFRGTQPLGDIQSHVEDKCTESHPNSTVRFNWSEKFEVVDKELGRLNGCRPRLRKNEVSQSLLEVQTERKGEQSAGRTEDSKQNCPWTCLFDAEKIVDCSQSEQDEGCRMTNSGIHEKLEWAEEHAIADYSGLSSAVNSSEPVQIMEVGFDKPEIQNQAHTMKLQGNEFYKQQKYLEAVECYSKAIDHCQSSDGEELSIYYQNRAAAYEQLKQWDKVVVDCAIAIEKNPRYTKAMYRKANAHEVLRDNMESYHNYASANYIERLMGRIPAPHHEESAGRLLASVGKQLAKERLQNLPTYLLSPYFLKEYLQVFNYDVFDVPITSAQCDQNYKRILINLKKMKYEKLMPLCEKEINENGKYKDRALLLKGTLNVFMGDNNTALVYFDITSQLPPTNENKLLRIHAHLSIACMKQNVDRDFQLALKSVDCAAAIDRHNASVYAIKGMILEEMGESEKANINMRIAISLDATFLEPHLRLAYSLSRDSLEEAERKYLSIIREFPDHANPYLRYSNVLFSNGRLEEAGAMLDKAISIAPNCPLAYRCKAELAKRDGDRNLAKKFLLKELEVDKNSSVAWKRLGSLELSEKANIEGYVKCIERATHCYRNETELTESYEHLTKAKVLAEVVKTMGAPFDAASLTRLLKM